MFIDSDLFCSGRGNRFRRNPIPQIRQRWLRRIRTHSQGSSLTRALLRQSELEIRDFLNQSGGEWENKLLRDRMQRHCLKVTCRTQEHYPIVIAHTSRFGIMAIAYLGRSQCITVITWLQAARLQLNIICNIFLLTRVSCTQRFNRSRLSLAEAEARLQLVGHMLAPERDPPPRAGKHFQLCGNGATLPPPAPAPAQHRKYASRRYTPQRWVAVTLRALRPII